MTREEIDILMKDSLPKGVVLENGDVHTGAMVDAVEEANFRLAAFARAYLGRDHQIQAVISRARVLQDCLSDLSAMLGVYANHHESAMKVQSNGKKDEMVREYSSEETEVK